MITLRQMISATPAAIRRRAGNQCYGKSARRSGKGKDEDGKQVEDSTGKFREFRFKVRCTDGWRDTSCRFYGPLNVNTKVWCWCSCPYFKYHCEVALASKGSSSVINSNGQRPRFTNSGEEPRVCKHVYLLFALALRERDPVDVEEDQKTETRDAPKDVLLPPAPVKLGPSPVKTGPAPINFGPGPGKGKF